MTVLTVYPDAGTGNTTVDGSVRRNNGGSTETFAQVRAGAGTAGSATNDIDVYFQAYAWTVSGNYLSILRSIFTYDTSSIGTGATISAATMSVWPTAITTTLASGTMGIVSYSGSANTVSSSDYAIANYGTTSFGTKTQASMSTGSYNDISLNASGLAAISTTSITKFGVRSEWDRANSPPTWKATSGSDVTGYFSDRTGTANDPKLVITYTSGPDPIELTETITITGNASRSPNPTKEETITITDGFDKALTMVREYLESITVIDNIIKALTKLLDEAFTIVDAISKGFAKAYTETTSIIDTVAKSTVFTRCLYETISIVENFVKKPTKLLTETVVIVGAFLKTQFKTLVEAISITDAIARQTNFVKEFLENISLDEYYASFLDGVKTSWRKVTRAASGVWNKITRPED